MTACQVNYTLCRLMSPDLPLSLDTERLARKGETIAGQYEVQDLQRLEGLLYDDTGVVRFNLEFTHDNDDNRSYIVGNIQANVNIICQRCLGSMPYNVDSRIYLGIVMKDANLSCLPDDCEPLVTENEPVSLRALIEDELILALPISALHAEDRCNATDIMADLKSSRNSTKPFAELKTLIRNSRK